MRETDIIVYDQDIIYVSDDLLGYAGETEATVFDITLPSDWTGNFYVDWKVSGTWTEGETAETLTEFEYTVPDAVLVKGCVWMRIRVVDGDTTAYTRLVKFKVK